MKRWIITLENHDYKPLIYADTPDEAKKWFKSENIVDISIYEDLSYLEDIKFLKNNSTYIGTEPKKNDEIREVYEVNLLSGKLIFKLSKNLSEDLYIDYAAYQFISIDSHVYPVTFTLVTPKELREIFFSGDLSCEIYSYRLYGQPKLSKPKELSGVKQSFSVEFIPKKCKCQCFIKDDDLWIKHRDFFSRCHHPAPEDCGTPLTYRLEKYFNVDKSYLDKFIYPDSWGEIVLRNEAWIVFRNIKKTMNMYKNTSSSTLKKAFLNAGVIKENYITKLDMTWERFFENICKEYTRCI